MVRRDGREARPGWWGVPPVRWMVRTVRPGPRGLLAASGQACAAAAAYSASSRPPRKRAIERGPEAGEDVGGALLAERQLRTADGVQDGGGDLVRPCERGELDEGDRDAEVADGLARQARLARPAGPDDGDQAGGPREFPDAGEVVVAADERGQRRRPSGGVAVGPRRRGGRGSPVL